MIQKTITITVDVPEGYAVKFNKNNNQIEFVDSKPKSWEEYCEQVKSTDCYITVKSQPFFSKRSDSTQYNTFNTKEEAKAFIALGKLIQLHKAWVKGWKPNWHKKDYKFVIERHTDVISIGKNIYIPKPLAFPTEEMRDEFIDTFKDLLEEAKPFL